MNHRVKKCKKLLVNYCWSIIAGQLLLVNYCWSIIAGQLLLVNYCWSIIAGQLIFEVSCLYTQLSHGIAASNPNLLMFKTD